MILRGRNSLPTAGEIRVARSRVDTIVAPVLRRLRTGLYFWLGAADLVVTAIRTRSARSPIGSDRPGTDDRPPTGQPRICRPRAARDDPEAAIQLAATAITGRGERRYARVRSFPPVRRALAELDGARKSVASETGRAVDEAHDSVEENLARIEVASRSIIDLTATRARDAVLALRPGRERTTEKSMHR